MGLVFEIWLMGLLLLQLLGNGLGLPDKFVMITQCNVSVFDGGFLESAYNALQQGVNDKGYPMEVVVEECSSPTLMIEMAEQQTEINFHFVVIGFELGAIYEGVCDQIPQARFTFVDYVPNNLAETSNMVSVVFAEDHGAFSAGVMAGLATNNKIVGGIFGVPIPVLRRFRNGFERGVHYVCPDCTIVSQYIHHFAAFDAGYKIARLYHEAYDADVLFTAAGYSGVGGLIAGGDMQVRTIGVDQDQFYTVFHGNTSNPGAQVLISSMLKRVDMAIERVLEDHFSGTFVGGKSIILDSNSLGMSMAPCHAACDKISPTLLTKVEQVEKLLGNNMITTGVKFDTGRFTLSMFWPMEPAIDEWSTLKTFGSMPAIHSAAVTETTFGPYQFERLVYLFGGRTEEFPEGTADLYSFDVDSMAWSKHQALLRGYKWNATFAGHFPQGRADACLVALRGAFESRIVLVGGINREKTRLNDVWLYEPPIPFADPYENWFRLESSDEDPQAFTPKARSGHMCASVSPPSSSQGGPDGDASAEVYCFGGIDSENKLLGDMVKLTIGVSKPNRINAPDFTWEKICDPCQPPSRSFGQMLVYKNQIYIHGGVGVIGTELADLWKFDPVSKEFKQLTSSYIPRARFSSSTGSIKVSGRAMKDVFLFIGGVIPDTVVSQDFVKAVHFYVPSEDRWSYVRARKSTGQCTTAQESDIELGTSLNGQTKDMRNRNSHFSFMIQQGVENLNDKLVVVGGKTTNDELLYAPEVFHFREDPVEEDRQLISQPIRIACYLMTFFNYAVATFCLLWMFVFRKSQVVKLSQRKFLSLVCLGCIISSSTIILLTQDDKDGDPYATSEGGNRNADLSCVLSIWMFGIGFATTMTPLYLKLHVILHVLDVSYNFKVKFGTEEMRKKEARKLSWGYLLGILLSVVMVETILCLVWTLSFPLTFKRQPIVVDEHGSVLQSRGLCQGENDVIFLATMAILHLVLILHVNWVCHKTANINTVLSEAKYIRYSVMSSLQLMLLCIPVMIVSSDNPSALMLLRGGFIFLSDLSVMLFIFVPKIYFTVQHGDSDIKLGELMMNSNPGTIHSQTGGGTSYGTKSFIVRNHASKTKNTDEHDGSSSQQYVPPVSSTAAVIPIEE